MIDHFVRQVTEVVRQHGLRNADEFIAVDRAVVFQPLRNPDLDLRRQVM